MGIEGKHFYRFTYLKSEEWRTVRLIALAKAEGRCSICGKIDWSNDAHHKIYPDDIWDTTPGHLAILCRGCHEKVHHRFGKEASKRDWRAVKRKIKEEDRIEYARLNPEDPWCIFCGRDDELSVLKTVQCIKLWICPSCDLRFQSVKREGWSFWKTFDAAKSEIRCVYLAMLVAAKRYFVSTQKENRKAAKRTRERLNDLYS